MHFLFTPNHIQLLSSCYPPTSALLTAGPAYAPSAHELSRLTYYASNHPGKLTKLGAEIEKRVRTEARKAKAGNLRARATLLITFAIFRALATECRRDIALISPALIASIDVALAATPQDLEVVARIASVFTAWTTYTNGQLIGTDHVLTQNYLSVLRQFAELSCSKSMDSETRNRTRLIGLAAITGALNSEALYNDSRQFKAQIIVLMRPILLSLFETNLSTLDEQSTAARDTPSSPYLAEFRTRPALERRAASIHLHIDGDKGPSSTDVSDACLRALFSLLEHAGGVQLGHIMQSSFDNLDAIDGWKALDHCCWYAKKLVEWAQYQYRFVVPTWLVDKLLENQDAHGPDPLQLALASMVEVINRIVMIEVQGPREDGKVPKGRSSALCHLLKALKDLIRMANEHEAMTVPGPMRTSRERSRSPPPRIEAQKPELTVIAPRRTRVSPELWQDTLSLICDRDLEVRKEYSDTLVYYLTEEMPKVGELLDADGVRRVPKLSEGAMLQVANVNLFLNSGDVGSQFLDALHAYAFILAINTTPGLNLPSQSPEQLDSAGPSSEDRTSSEERRRSMSISGRPRARKASLQRRLTLDPVSLPVPPLGWEADYASLRTILQTVQNQLPIRGLLTGVPMLARLSNSIANSPTSTLAGPLSAIIVELWKTIGEIWESKELVEFAERVLSGGTVPREVDSANVLQLLADCVHVQAALGTDAAEILRRLSVHWTPKGALYGFTERTTQAFDATVRGDNLSPLLKLSPALMQIENLSLQSLAKSTRGLGVSDLREALEGRNNMSNPALAKAASISTYDYTSSMTGGDVLSGLGLTPTRSRTKASPRKASATSGDVKDVLSKLGIGKQSNTRLKTPFQSVAQKMDS
ncbi:EFR3 [Coprinopsis cinerea okayama7|uniref:EFR3 n=1 Tax=Coprinopsis cinerea (strain Okayama-7 / 130 / ATCC MYA-4618 / FGSC 9003) TaxID=240176 RepID=A8NXW5_COPC7|nr:EFR3 [Coprinopsis cinerea okayama7\|eukprot:XP_001837287.2 EFR3 [Coprinopsis cinerea okayama7\